MQQMTVADTVFSDGAPGIEALLGAAYTAKQRPRCLCTEAGIPMYIAHVGERLIVKRMPNTGHLHAPRVPVLRAAGRAVRSRRGGRLSDPGRPGLGSDNAAARFHARQAGKLPATGGPRNAPGHGAHRRSEAHPAWHAALPLGAGRAQPLVTRHDGQAILGRRPAPVARRTPEQVRQRRPPGRRAVRPGALVRRSEGAHRAQPPRSARPAAHARRRRHQADGHRGRAQRVQGSALRLARRHQAPARDAAEGRERSDGAHPTALPARTRTLGKATTKRT